MTEPELVELVLRAKPYAGDTGATLKSLLEWPPVFGASAGDHDDGPAEPRRGRRRPRPPRPNPPDDLLDRARLHGRGLEPRWIALASLSEAIDLDPSDIADGLNRAKLMVSLPVDEVPPDIDRWGRVFQLAAALGTSSVDVRTRALTEYAESDMWDWSYLPLDARSDELLGWVAGPFMLSDPKRAARVFTTLVTSPEAFRVTAGRVLRIFDDLDGDIFAPLVGVLSRLSYSRLAREDPVRRLVQEIVRCAVERSGDSTLAAGGLEVLVGDAFGAAMPPASRDLALAATVATFVVNGRPGWRNPLLRPALVEAALHGAPGCRRAALMLGVG